jgi:hypothetical protein
MPASTPSPSAPGAPASATTPAPDTTTSGKPPKTSLLDAVLKVTKVTPEPDVLRGKQEESGGPPKPPGETVDGQATDPQNPEEEDKPTPDDDPLTDFSAAGQKKVRKLLRERRQLRDQIMQMQPDANVGTKLTSFARDNDLAPDDIVLGMNAMAAIRRGDYASFYQQVAPFVRKAQEVLGLVLPQDLGQRVQQGGMTEQAARELAQARFREQQAQEEARANAARVDTQQLQFVQADVQRAVTAFEERIAANDPDYRAKADAIRRVAQALLHEKGGRISSVQEALEIVQHAHREVTNQFRRFAPAARPTNPIPNGNSQQPNARAAPKTLMEAALQGLENARRRVG